MKAQITGFMFRGLEKKTFLELEIDGNHAEEIEKLKDKPVDLSLKVFRQKRSLNANSYAWVLINKVAEKMQLEDTVVYQKYIKEVGLHRDVEIEEAAADTLSKVWNKYGIGWVSEKVDFGTRDGFVLLRLWYGSSVYNTQQMSRFIDYIVQDCKSLGIETMTPEQIEQMISQGERN